MHKAFMFFSIIDDCYVRVSLVFLNVFFFFFFWTRKEDHVG